MPAEPDPGLLSLRRTLVFRARSEQRLTYRQIAAALKRGTPNPASPGDVITFDIAPTTVREDFYHVLREFGYVPDPAMVEEQRAEELLKLDQLEDVYWPRAVGYTNDDGGKVPGDTVAANLVLRVARQRAQLAGLNQVRISGADGGPVQVELSVPDDLIAQILTDSLERAAQAEAAAAPLSMN